jgi:hypothetical protein
MFPTCFGSRLGNGGFDLRHAGLGDIVGMFGDRPVRQIHDGVSIPP